MLALRLCKSSHKDFHRIRRRIRRTKTLLSNLGYPSSPAGAEASAQGSLAVQRTFQLSSGPRFWCARPPRTLKMQYSRVDLMGSHNAGARNSWQRCPRMSCRPRRSSPTVSQQSAPTWRHPHSERRICFGDDSSSMAASMVASTPAFFPVIVWCFQGLWACPCAFAWGIKDCPIRTELPSSAPQCLECNGWVVERNVLNACLALADPEGCRFPLRFQASTCCPAIHQPLNI